MAAVACHFRLSRHPFSLLALALGTSSSIRSAREQETATCNWQRLSAPVNTERLLCGCCKPCTADYDGDGTRSLMKDSCTVGSAHTVVQSAHVGERRCTAARTVCSRIVQSLLSLTIVTGRRTLPIARECVLSVLKHSGEGELERERELLPCTTVKEMNTQEGKREGKCLSVSM